MKNCIDNWWADQDIELIRINDKVYALYGWNGEKYTDCWECTGEYYMNASSEKYEIKPIYEETPNGDFEIVGYEAC